MELYGSVEDNLKAAVRSARRFRGSPVHRDTIQHWSDLLNHARHEHAVGDNRRVIGSLIIDLEGELAHRKILTL
jgi:hypothetical protein